MAQEMTLNRKPLILVGLLVRELERVQADVAARHERARSLVEKSRLQIQESERIIGRSREILRAPAHISN